jgi:hypothetical protein
MPANPHNACFARPYPDTLVPNGQTFSQPAPQILLSIDPTCHGGEIDHHSIGRATVAGDNGAILYPVRTIPQDPAELREGSAPMGTIGSIHLRLAVPYLLILVHLSQITGADYAMSEFVKITGRRPEEGPLSDLRIDKGKL